MTTIQTDTVDPTLLATMNGSKTSKTSTEDAQNRFMTLLVTQLKNQDPLNPMDNAQVTSQMAQLSTVSGIDKLNATVTALNASFQTGQNLQAANMIGHGVIAPGSNMTVTDGKGIYALDLPQAADKVDAVIRDSSGAVVRKISLGALPQGVNTLTWDGKTDAGATAANGVYKFEFAASSGDKKLDATSLAFGVVSSITSGSQGLKLSLANVGDVSMSDVRQIY
ncbi:flagellar hook assembly protein FlgD [Undibacterium sp. TS12]|uniref:flagellar hook assembly protein FlgD n=1 Tax=Undibacterium sp. TS12 TaxID=2908202 RepID=UPI001F4C5308|nr:flagellar hook assembly protein FlgD [Undibacterium sp. TS12]MCH8619023.1 flagellar hook assembly protein FlgD [Undibacterium sp. TS12]